MELKETSGSGSNCTDTATRKHVLLIGPPPYKDGGSRVTFDLMLQYMRKFPHLMIHNLDLPVHHPLYTEGGASRTPNHLRTVIGVLRAATLVPRVDNVILFGSSDVCFSYGLALMLCAKLFRKRCAVRIMGGRGVLNTKLLPAFARSGCLIIAQAADVILTESEAARNDFPVRLRSKATVIKGFRPIPPSESPSVRCTEGGIRFVFVGKAEPDKRQPTTDVKGLDILLDAVDRIRTSPIRKFSQESTEGIEFHVYGLVSPNMAERMQRMPDVAAHGTMANDRLRDALRQHDVLVFPSRANFTEGHPGAIIEAFMAGLPVIASDLPGPSEIVHHEVNGLIVGTGDADALAAAMMRLATDSALRRRLAVGACASASDFDQDKILPDLIKAFGLL